MAGRPSRLLSDRAASDNVTHGSWIIVAVALGALTIALIATPQSPVHAWLACPIGQIADISSAQAPPAACTGIPAPFTADAPAPMIGYQAPSGTWVDSTTATEQTSEPVTNTIDGNLQTYWDPTDTSPTLDLEFSSVIALKAVQVAVSTPPVSISGTVTAYTSAMSPYYNDTLETEIGSASYSTTSTSASSPTLITIPVTEPSALTADDDRALTLVFDSSAPSDGASVYFHLQEVSFVPVS